MFKKVTPSKSPVSIPTRKSLPPHYPVLNVETLLNNPSITQLIGRIKGLMQFEEVYWENCCLPVIKNYINYVQGLPALNYKAFNKHYGLLQLGLLRCLEVLSAYRKEQPIHYTKPEDVPAKTVLFTYALMTASLFYGLGQLEAIYWVALCDNKGFHGKKWQPLLGDIASQGEYYRYTLKATPPRDQLANFVTPIIAMKILMTDLGLELLGKDKNLFTAWIGFLLNESDAGSMIAKFILPLDGKLAQLPIFENTLHPHKIENYLDYSEKDPHDKVKSMFEHEIPEKTLEEAIQLAENLSNLDIGKKILFGMKSSEFSGEAGFPEIGQAFLEWLNRIAVEGVSIRSGRRNALPIGQLLQQTAEGMFLLYPDAMLEFSKDNPKYNNPSEVLKALQELGIVGQQLIDLQTKAGNLKLSSIAAQTTNPRKAISITDLSLIPADKAAMSQQTIPSLLSLPEINTNNTLTTGPNPNKKS